VIVATKVWTSKDPEVNSTASLNRKHIREAIDRSLKRLDMEYVDILFAHGFDPETPLEEIVRAFHEVIESGKSFYWGTSNWNAEDVYSAFSLCEKYNLHKPICGQNQYNMLERKDM
jgi:aryl-alcohol dehydrogenase-like predicted oxidoreductase